MPQGASLAKCTCTARTRRWLRGRGRRQWQWRRIRHSRSARFVQVLLHSRIITSLKAVVTGVLVRVHEALTPMAIARGIARRVTVRGSTDRGTNHLLLRHRHSRKDEWNGESSAGGCECSSTHRSSLCLIVSPVFHRPIHTKATALAYLARLMPRGKSQGIQLPRREQEFKFLTGTYYLSLKGKNCLTHDGFCDGLYHPDLVITWPPRPALVDMSSGLQRPSVSRREAASASRCKRRR